MIYGKIINVNNGDAAKLKKQNKKVFQNPNKTKKQFVIVSERRFER